MAQITSKELGGISDLLSMEQTIIAKYKQFATDTQDSAISAKYEQLACRHQRHYDELLSNLK
ncbi:MAG: spore coat protein [Clostridia bacterium]|nr:spore coat protein [Clostridia bacterium]